MKISKIRTQEFWLNHIASWKKAGLSQNKYCRQNSIKSSNQFIQLPAPMQTIENFKSDCRSKISVVLKNRFRIILRDGFSIGLLKNIVNVLEKTG